MRHEICPVFPRPQKIWSKRTETTDENQRSASGMLLAISLLACSLGAHAVLITTNSSFVNVEVNGADFNLDFIERPPALPLALTDSVVSPDGTATSAATYDFFNNPNNAAFNIDYVFGLEDSFSASASGTIIFDVAETLSYVLSGSFNATSDDPDDELRQLFD